MNQAITKHPIDLVQHTRFDLMFKYLYIKHRELNLNTAYYEEMYKHHIEIWNNFKEFNNPNKNTYENFKEIFHNISDSIKAKGFDPNTSTVQVCNNYIVNGTHRVAACLLHNKMVYCLNQPNQYGGQIDCSFYFFRNGYNIKTNYCDRAAIEYIKFKKNTFIVSLFPSATQVGHIEEVKNILHQNGNIVYEKPVSLNQQGGLHFMKELYYKEDWAEANARIGYATKRDYCFTNDTPMYIFLVEFDSKELSHSVKQEIRKIYNLGKHSVHINDSYEETVRLSKCLFNENSIHFINNSKLEYYESFEEQLNYYKEYIKQNGLDIEDYCITASSVLSAYGLRECNDLDYLHNGSEIQGHPMIHSHNSYGVDRYHTDKDNIIYNPKNHFYFHGVKIASIDTVRKMKQKRDEEKDRRDVLLMENL